MWKRWGQMKDMVIENFRTSPVLLSISTIRTLLSSTSLRDMGRHRTTTFTHSGSFLAWSCKNDESEPCQT
jgi:hypothetical protein